MLSWLFVALSGVSYRKADEHDEVGRYAKLGVLVVLVTAWTWTLWAVFLHRDLKVGVWVSIGFAGVYAVVVAVVDMLTNGSALMKDGFFYRVRFMLIRAALAVAAGAVVSQIALITLNSGTINATAAGDAATITTNLDYTVDHGPLPAQIAKDKATEKTLASQVASDNATASKDLSAAQCEARGTCGTGVPDGPNQIGWATKARLNIAKTARNKVTTDQNTQKYQDAVLNKQIDSDQAGLQTAHQHDIIVGQQQSTSYATQSKILWHLVLSSPDLWALVIVLILFDLLVPFMKTILPASNLDLAKRQDALDQATLRQLRTTSPAVHAALNHKLDNEAQIITANSDAETARRLARIAARRAKRPLAPAWQRATAVLGVLALIAGAALITDRVATRHGSAPSALAAPTSSAAPATRMPMVVADGHSASLGQGETFQLPSAAISGGNPVSISRPSEPARSGYTNLTTAAAFTTAGSISKDPMLRLKVPTSLASAANANDIEVAFRSNTPSGWTQYPVTYSAKTHTLTAAMKHFSVWSWFLNLDWAEGLADITQTFGELTGRRAAGASCTSTTPLPSWYNTNAGIGNTPDEPIRSCVEGHETNGSPDGLLDIELVNNRPYGMLLSYGGVPVNWGWHDTPGNVPDAIRDAIGDWVASQSDALYLPPLSRASVGIPDIGNGKNDDFEILPSTGTVVADIVDIVAGKVLDNGVQMAAASQIKDAFGAVGAGDCSGLANNFLTTVTSPNSNTITELLSDSSIYDCITDVLTIAARNEIQGGMDSDTINALSKAISFLNPASDLANAAAGANLLANVGDFYVDKTYAAVQGLGYGFSILSHYTYQGPTSPSPSANPPASNTTPTQPASPSTTAPSSAPTTAPSTPPSSASPQPVTFYNEYASTTDGVPMCRGTTDNPRDLPGGTATQAFTAATTGVITSAEIDIDLAPSVTATAALSVNGALMASNAQTAGGDTYFSFNSIPVNAGDQVTLSVQFSSTDGTIITVYLVPFTGGQFTAANSCTQDNMSRNETALGMRAVVSGTGSVR